MTQTTQQFPFGKYAKYTKYTKNKPEVRPSKAWLGERRELEKSLSRTSAELHQTYQAFNTTCEAELIESYIFQINALHARYNYLLRRLKEGALC